LHRGVAFGKELKQPREERESHHGSGNPGDPPEPLPGRITAEH